MEQQNNPYESPSAAPGGVAVPQMGPKEILFGFEGRIPRRTYWMWSLITGFGFGIVISIIMTTMMFTVTSTVESGGEPSSSVAVLPMIIVILLYIPYVWIAFALQVKRWHDRNKSGWWWLIALVPLVGGIWAFIEVGCLRGTIGQNEYGPDPT